jgi:pyruvate/2-oxoglutarate dehydrogenase complex dihydrolipoamide dehydrogenase (E3) component
LTYDAVIIGSGQGGNPLAYRLSQEGHSVAIIEPGKLGGTCVNTGCTPTKTLVACARVAHYIRNAAHWSIHTSGPRIDLPGIQRQKELIVGKSRSSWEKKFAGVNPHLYRATARFVGPNEVQAGEHIIKGARIFIDTGMRPAIPDLAGIDSVPHLTNVSILELTEIPSHLLILGGGYIGLEFAQMFRRFGSDVTVIQSNAQLLSQEDADITSELQRALEAEGIQIYLNTRANRVAYDGRVSLDVQTAATTKSFTGSHLLLATGRKPNTDELDLDKAGVQMDARGYIVVNDRLETTAQGVWALGDVTGGPAFTHISYNDYQILYANIFEGKSLSTNSRQVPYAVYTDPELGRVGLTERAARARGRKLKIGLIPMTWVSRAIERGETAGCMKIVVDAGTDKILGAACLCSEGGEVIQILGTLMLCDQPYTLLKGAIYIHPTIAEGLFTLMDSVKPVE